MARNHRPFIVTGSGRCGTGYTAKLLQQLGYPCGHEEVFSPDAVARDRWQRRFLERRCDASWLALPCIDQLPRETVVFHQVRNPVAVIRSLMGMGFLRGTEAQHQPYVDVAASVVPLPADELEADMVFWLEWNRRIPGACAGRTHALYRLEELTPELVREMVQLVEPGRELGDEEIAAAFAAVPTNYNTRPRAHDVRWDTLPEGELKEQIAQLAEVCGYSREDLQAA